MATSSTQLVASQSNSSQLNRRFTEKLMTKICCFYDEQSLIDVTFKLSNPASLVPAHRLILSAASPYFEDLFNGDQSNTLVIEINDIDGDIFERLITFCYTGQTLVNVENVAAMLKAANVLQLEDAATTCVEFLMSHINECTLQGVYALERESQFELLKQKVLEYEIQNFMEISQLDEFLNFDVEKLQCLLESNNLNITCEEDAYDAITRWFNHDVAARREHLPRLIACLRLTQFDVDFLLTHIQALPGCELMAFMASTWICKATARNNINIRFTEPRVGLSAANRDKTLLALYGGDTAENISMVQYNKAEDKWEKYASINNNNANRSAVLNDDNILFIGGNKSPSKTVLSWNIRNKTWRELPTMKQERRSHCVVELGGKIYAFGGIGNNYAWGDVFANNVLNSVERYTPSNGWEFVKPLNIARSEAVAVTFNGKIYIMGGWNQKYLRSVECYNPDSNTWTSCADMTNCYSQPGVAAHNGYIFVVGGFSDGQHVHHERYDSQPHQVAAVQRRQQDITLFMPRGAFTTMCTGVSRTVERYDPQRNTWSTICCLEGNRCGDACASFDNKLWHIGGRVGNANETRVATYDEGNNGWIQKSSLPKGKIHCCLVVSLPLRTSK